MYSHSIDCARFPVRPVTMPLSLSRQIYRRASVYCSALGHRPLISALLADFASFYHSPSVQNCLETTQPVSKCDIRFNSTTALASTQIFARGICGSGKLVSNATSHKSLQKAIPLSYTPPHARPEPGPQKSRTRCNDRTCTCRVYFPIVLVMDNTCCRL